MKLNDTTIAHFVKLIQVAFITGTDIVDHFRMMELELNSEKSIVLNEEYEKIFEEQIEKMLENANTQNEKVES